MEMIEISKVKNNAIRKKIFNSLYGFIPAVCKAMSSKVLESFVIAIDVVKRKEIGNIIKVVSGSDKKIKDSKYFKGILKPVISYIFVNLITVNIKRMPKKIPLNREKNSFKRKLVSFFFIIHIIMLKKI